MNALSPALHDYELLFAGRCQSAAFPPPVAQARNRVHTIKRVQAIKVERFGQRIIARDCRTLESMGSEIELDRSLRDSVDAWFVPPSAKHTSGAWICREGNSWRPCQEVEPSWKISQGNLRLELNQAPSGQVGFFPEHASHWPWLENLPLRGKSILNLFAYTGAMSLKLAECGANVTHVDSAKSVVNWARRNLDQSTIGEASIRWIVEDAETFVGREIKRGNRYDGYVCDPPSFGRGRSAGTGGKGVWKMEQHLPGLLAKLAELTERRPGIALVTSHTPGVESRRLTQWLREAYPEEAPEIESGSMRLPQIKARRFPADGTVDLGKHFARQRLEIFRCATIPNLTTGEPKHRGRD